MNVTPTPDAPVKFVDVGNRVGVGSLVGFAEVVHTLSSG